jgi:hypothetical protein
VAPTETLEKSLESTTNTTAYSVSSADTETVLSAISSQPVEYDTAVGTQGKFYVSLSVISGSTRKWQSGIAVGWRTAV